MAISAAEGVRWWEWECRAAVAICPALVANPMDEVKVKVGVGWIEE